MIEIDLYPKIDVIHKIMLRYEGMGNLLDFLKEKKVSIIDNNFFYFLNFRIENEKLYIIQDSNTQLLISYDDWIIISFETTYPNYKFSFEIEYSETSDYDFFRCHSLYDKSQNILLNNMPSADDYDKYIDIYSEEGVRHNEFRNPIDKIIDDMRKMAEYAVTRR